MRIIAGTWRGRTLLGPIGKNTRPILDRVKASAFDILGAHFGIPGQIPAIFVLDLFCGTGSMGLECLSRGAAGCVFVDRDRTAIRRLRANIRQLRASNRAIVLVGSAHTVDLLPPAARPYQLVFVDPPYRQSHDCRPDGRVARLFGKLAEPTVTTPDVLVVCRHEAKYPLEVQMPPYRQTDVRKYGRMAISMYQHAVFLDEAPPSS